MRELSDHQNQNNCLSSPFRSSEQSLLLRLGTHVETIGRPLILFLSLCALLNTGGEAFYSTLIKTKSTHRKMASSDEALQLVLEYLQ